MTAAVCTAAQRYVFVQCRLPGESFKERSQSGGNSWTRRCELWACYISCHPPREAKRPCLTAITSLQSEHLLDRQCVPPADNGRKKKSGCGQISLRVPGTLPALHICSQPLSQLPSPELPSDGWGPWAGPELTSQKGDLASLSWSLGLEFLPEPRGKLTAERVNQGHICEESWDLNLRKAQRDTSVLSPDWACQRLNQETWSLHFTRD